MAAFLSCVALRRNVTGHNVESWVTAVEGKLADIDIFTPQMAIANRHAINSKLIQVGHVPLYLRTLALMNRDKADSLAAPSANEASITATQEAPGAHLMKASSSNMTSFLSHIAVSRGVAEDEMASWVPTVENKLTGIGLSPFRLQSPRSKLSTPGCS
jgi:hypothetical protein